jgi:hypothetical protein
VVLLSGAGVCGAAGAPGGDDLEAKEGAVPAGSCGYRH